MTTQEPPEPGERTAGSVPHAYRNALFWHWAPHMPKGLPAAFVTLLYALAAAADPSGRLRFRDGVVIRIKDIAAACKADEKDVRRYIEAAIAAGVLAVEGERRRGHRALYALIVHPAPDWDGAVRSIQESKRTRKDRQAPPWQTDENGAPAPELSTAENGGPPPVPEVDPDEEERGTAPRMGSGDRPPNGTGGGPPNNPGSTHGVSHGRAEVGSQPQVDDAWHLREPPAEDEPDDPDPGPVLRAIEGGGRGPGGGQAPLLLTVQVGPAPPLDTRRLSDHLSALYGVPVRRDQAVRLAEAVLGPTQPQDPTAAVLAAVEADPARYRHHLPTGRRAAGDS